MSYADTLRLRLIQEKGGKCEKCGFADIRALVLHHVNYDRNEDPISELRKMFLRKKTYQVLCMNCHAILHERRERRILRRNLKLGIVTEKDYLRVLNEILRQVRRLDRLLFPR